MDTRLQAANTILERGVRFRLPAPFYKRWLKKDFVTIRHLKAGTILEISRVVLESKLEEAVTFGDHEFLHKAVEPCARCIAIAILNDKGAIEKKVDKLTERLIWQVSAESLIDIFLKISVMNRMSDFMTITKYFLNRMTTMMNRRSLGHGEDGS
ncbi:hypothetical protein SAMN05216357_112129 [Porphyromonadaceae bacterium KH3CP3RA]|nr:hypothetical protein SAMN05216357_112129 [Porphyromonadaceae bacterium KH3CP3RA]